MKIQECRCQLHCIYVSWDIHISITSLRMILKQLRSVKFNENVGKE